MKIKFEIDKKIIFFTVAIVIAIVVGYFFGLQNQQIYIGKATTTTQVAKPIEGEIASPIYGHVHALAYIQESKTLLLGAHYGFFKSTDSGSNFVKVKPKGYWPVDDVMGFAVHPQNHKIVYASGHDLGVVKSLDGGETWEKSDSGIQGSDIHGLTINQRAPNYLFAFSEGYGMFRSNDGGASWKRMDDGPENPSVRSLSYMAVQTDMDKNMRWDNWGLLFAGTADGLYQSFSCFCGWVKSSQDISTTIYSLATHHSDLTTMYAATKDGLLKSTDEGKNWLKLNSMTSGKRFGAIAIDQSDIKHLFAATEDGLVFESFDSGKIWMLK